MVEIPFQEEADAVIQATTNLYGVSGMESFMLEIPNTKPKLYVIAGDAEQIRSALDLLSAQKLHLV